MTPREKKSIEVELMKVTAAKASMELKIMEREEDISRLHSDIKIQDDKIVELKEKLDGFKS